MNAINRRVLETAKRRLVEAQADLDALLEEPEDQSQWARGEAVGHVGTRLHEAFRKDFFRARHYDLELNGSQVDYLARVALDAEIIIGDSIFRLGALPAYTERLERNQSEDSAKLKAQSEQIRELKAAVEEAKTKCPVCAGAGELPIEEFTSGDVLNRRVMRKCPAPVHSL